MKKKLLIVTILVMHSLLVSLVFSKVEANNTLATDDVMGDSTDTKADTKEEEKTDTKEETKTDNEARTDFSKAKFSLKKNGIANAIVEISGVTPKENVRYDLVITSNSSKPNVNTIKDDDKIYLAYDKESKKFTTDTGDEVARYVELNQDLYANIIEEKVGEYKEVISYGNKLTRFSEPKYSDAFFATFMAYSSDQIVTNFTHHKSNNRKMQIKVGKITNTSILQKIKDKNTSGFTDLLKFAKSNSGIYNKTVNADKDTSYAIEYNAGRDAATENSVINLKGLKSKEYYFLYVKTDDENGKYISSEAVTLAQADVNNDGKWWMFFYGSSDFKWTDFKNESNNSKPDVEADPSEIEEDDNDDDETTVPTKLPNTGAEIMTFIAIILVISIGGFVAYKKYKWWNV